MSVVLPSMPQNMPNFYFRFT